MDKNQICLIFFRREDHAVEHRDKRGRTATSNLISSRAGATPIEETSVTRTVAPGSGR
jgi:hypothetical protein